MKPTIGPCVYRPSLRRVCPSLLRIAAKRYPSESLMDQAKGLASYLDSSPYRECLRQYQQNIKVDRGHLKKYCQLIGIDLSRNLPQLYPQVLMGPLQLRLLADKHFSLNMLGAVHKENFLTRFRPIHIDEVLDLELEMSKLSIHEGGVEIELDQKVFVSNTLVWRSVSSFWVKNQNTNKRVSTRPKKELEAINVTDSVSPINSSDVSNLTWCLSSSAGLKYALLTGDFNPIHVSNRYASMQGYKKAIGHGFCILAMGLERWQSNVNCEIKQAWCKGAWELRVAFKGPNYLGNDLKLIPDLGDSTTDFEWFCGANTRPTITTTLGA